MPGAVIILVVMVILGPIAVMLAGAVWTALMGWMLVGEADARAGEASSDAG